MLNILFHGYQRVMHRTKQNTCTNIEKLSIQLSSCSHSSLRRKIFPFALSVVFISRKSKHSCPYPQTLSTPRLTFVSLSDASLFSPSQYALYNPFLFSKSEPYQPLPASYFADQTVPTPLCSSLPYLLVFIPLPLSLSSPPFTATSFSLLSTLSCSSRTLRRTTRPCTSFHRPAHSGVVLPSIDKLVEQLPRVPLFRFAFKHIPKSQVQTCSTFTTHISLLLYSTMQHSLRTFCLPFLCGELFISDLPSNFGLPRYHHFFFFFAGLPFVA